ncbi:MAG: ABC transporter ATP-binding protein [Nitrososphaerota archaeon]|nr:ABC transporter ATP-binding protein [Nitrososphaerota archaeon]
MIETEGLTKRFGDVTAVDSVSLSVAEGEVFGFLGPNGAGKTTTVRMLCCLISKTSGEARIGDYDVSKGDDSIKIRKMIGVVPDNVGLYEPLSAYKNLDLYGRLYGMAESKRKESIERYLNLLGLWEKRDVAAGTFSKGMKQKLAIARALLHDPEVLFMDEPTANLDPESAKTVRDFILDLKKEKRTIFLNSHNLAEVERVCDRVAILNTRLKATGTPSELERMVGGRSVVVDLAQASEAVVASLRKKYSGLTTAQDGVRLSFTSSDPDGQIPDIVEAVVRAGGRVKYAGVEGSSLEATYLQLVKSDA